MKNEKKESNEFLLTLSFSPRRRFIFPHFPSPHRGGSPNEPSPQLYTKSHI